MGDRQERLRRAFAALADGDVTPFEDLLAPDAEWVAIPRRRHLRDPYLQVLVA
jgi:ketosteroid isomerase-like protein